MLKRKMLIIANPGEIGDEYYCEGVNKDVENYLNFFTSAIGGAWSTDEITTLKRPNPVQVDQAVNQLRMADYSVVIFCGHGYSLRNGDTMLELKRNVTYDSMRLRQGAGRHVMILDCCREVVQPLMESAQERYFLKHFDQQPVSLQAARAYYDNAVERCQRGLIVLHGCDINECAGDDSRLGGYYSYMLCSAARQWSSSPSGGQVSSIVAIHNTASEAVETASKGTQHPQIEKPRSGPYFPFAVAEYRQGYGKYII